MTRAEAGRLGAQVSKVKQHEKFLQRREEYYKNPILCLQCGGPIPYEGISEVRRKGRKFCSQSCAATYNNMHRDKKTFGECPVCGKPIRNKHNKYCSQECSTKARIDARYQDIEETGEFPEAFQGEASRPLVRKYLERKYGHKCSICGTTEWMGKPVPLVVDHIDGNALNRKVENFRLVCANCDAQLPTYKSKNKHGRKWRRKYEHNDVLV